MKDPPPRRPSRQWRLASGRTLPMDAMLGTADAVVPLSVTQGDVVGEKYRLLSPVAEGGMGSVWLARNEALEIDVAIKLIRADLKKQNDAYFAQRLQSEARAAARLGHRAIVRVFDFGETSAGEAYIVMEWLDGEDLASALERRGRAAPIAVVRSVLPIADALVVAHAAGIIHRDLKPGNIFLARTRDGTVQPKLIDFGVAAFGEAVTTTLSGRKLLGSPGYMAPEQVVGDPTDAATDVWGLAVVLYECIAGTLPYVAESMLEAFGAILSADPIPFEEHGVGDPELWAIVERGLAKTPTDRWPTMRDFGAALAAWLMSQGISEDLCGSALETVWAPRSQQKRDVLSEPPPPGLVNDMWTQLVLEQLGDEDGTADLEAEVRSWPTSSSIRTLSDESELRETAPEHTTRVIGGIHAVRTALDAGDVDRAALSAEQLLARRAPPGPLQTVLALAVPLLCDAFEAYLGGSDAEVVVDIQAAQMRPELWRVDGMVVKDAPRVLDLEPTEALRRIAGWQRDGLLRAPRRKLG